MLSILSGIHSLACALGQSAKYVTPFAAVCTWQQNICSACCVMLHGRVKVSVHRIISFSNSQKYACG